MSVSRVVLQFAPGAPYVGYAEVAFHAGGGAPGISNLGRYIGGANVAIGQWTLQTVWTGARPASSDLRVQAALSWTDPGGKHLTVVNVPSQPSWYLSDGETVDETNVTVMAVRSVIVSAGLCSPDGTTMTLQAGGWRVNVSPAPWPLL